MDSLRPRNSTRAKKARSVRSVPKSQRKPAPKPPKLRTPADVDRDARRTLAGGPCEKLCVIPTLATALREIHERLEAALSATSLCVIALKTQAADHDIDIALCLECCVEQ